MRLRESKAPRAQASFRSIFLQAGMICLAAGLGSRDAARASTESIVNSLSAAQDGAGPIGDLVWNKSGALLYGATVGGGPDGHGAVFVLRPPASGTAVAVRIYGFTGGDDGSAPNAGLIVDRSGALYGTTVAGGAGSGVVFKLTPPTAGHTAWTETVLYRFSGAKDGSGPTARLLMDAAGALYGTTPAGGKGHGVVFELTPPVSGQGAWTETVLYAFTGGKDGGVPKASLIMDSVGALYGTASVGGSAKFGAVFKLTPPPVGKSAWTETVVFSFPGVNGYNPVAGLTLDKKGALYGTTEWGGAGDGIAFKLTPPGVGKSAWTETVLHVFGQLVAPGILDGSWAASGLTMDSAGALYGTTLYDGSGYSGVVYKLSPPPHGQKLWVETLLHSFAGGRRDGNVPQGGVVLDKAGVVYGTTGGGGSRGDGVVFKIVP